MKASLCIFVRFCFNLESPQLSRNLSNEETIWPEYSFETTQDQLSWLFGKWDHHSYDALGRAKTAFLSTIAHVAFYHVPTSHLIHLMCKNSFLIDIDAEISLIAPAVEYQPNFGLTMIRLLLFMIKSPKDLLKWGFLFITLCFLRCINITSKPSSSIRSSLPMIL